MAGTRVMLRSFFPSVIITVRVSGFQPDPGICTVTSCSPTVSEVLMGVTFPVNAVSTQTSAPSGNEVTWRLPPAAKDCGVKAKEIRLSTPSVTTTAIFFIIRPPFLEV
jgi:hypothetical protein